MKFLGHRQPCCLRGLVAPRSVAARAQKTESSDVESLISVGTTVGRATMNVLMDKIEDATAKLSVIRAERIKILQRFPGDPVQATTDLLQDIQARPLPSPQDIANEISSTVDAIQQSVDAEINATAAEEEKINENLIPESPDAQEVLDELRADVAAARSLTRKLTESEKAK